jgi:hypothetical protein
MPVIVSTKTISTTLTQQVPVTQPVRFRVRGEKILLRWRLARVLGWLLHAIEDPSGNPIAIVGGEVSYFVVLSQAALDAAEKAAAEAQNQAPPGKRNIIETPGMMIPRKRPN